MVLQSIRDRISGILAFAVLGILVIPFAFVGINSYFSSGAENLVARVNDTDITTNEFNQSFARYRLRMQSIMGDAFDPDQYDTLVARREHLDSMIERELLIQAAREIALDIDDERLSEQIRSIPAFQVDGQFNRDVYLGRLASQGLTVRQFEEDMRSQFITNQLPVSLLGSSIATGTELADFVALQNQARSFRAILVPPREEAAMAPDEEAIAAYYENNRQLYQSEEMVGIEYVELDVLDIATGTEPDDEFLRNRFEQQKARFLSPEQRLVSHVLIEAGADADEAVIETARQEAQDVADRVRAGEDFAELAKELSDDIGSAEFGGDLGWLEPGVMSESFEEAMYALTLENPISDPVQTGFGWHVIQLRDIQPATGMGFEEAREILVREHEEEEAEREFLEMADRLVDIVYEDPTTLEAAALDLGLEVQTTGPFSRAGGEGIAANPEVVKAAFSELVLLQGSVSDPIDLGENHMVMVRVREHLPAATRPLDEVRDQVARQLLDEQALAAARAQADQMLAELESGGTDLDGLAERNGFEVVAVEAAVRTGFDPDRTVVQEVFRLPPPEEGASLRRVVDADNGYALVELNSVTPGQLAEGSRSSELQYRRQIANAAASVEVTALIRQLRAAADVEVFEERLR